MAKADPKRKTKARPAATYRGARRNAWRQAKDANGKRLPWSNPMFRYRPAQVPA